MMTYKIDMIPSHRATAVHVSQGDTSLRRLCFWLTANGETIDLTDQTVTFVCENGAEHDCEIEDGKAFLDCFADMTEKAGQFFSKLRIEDSDGIVSSAGFMLEVEERP